MGRLGSETPARERRTASATACTACSCPISRLPISVSICKSLSVSVCSIFPVGIPVQDSTTSATSVGPTLSTTMASKPSLSCSCFSAAAIAAWICGISPFCSRPALSQSPLRIARSNWVFSLSSWARRSPTLLREAFSDSQRTLSSSKTCCCLPISARKSASRDLVCSSRPSPSESAR